MNSVYVAKQFRRALQLFARTIEDESTMMEIADVFPVYEVGHAYVVGDVFRYGVNSDGESQLYQVLQAHTSSAEWTPDSATSLYKKVGYTDSGIPIWTQPLGASDAYQTGDRVQHNDKIWVSTADSNVWEPGVYGWDEVVE